MGLAKGLARGYNPYLSTETGYRLHNFVCIVSAKLQVRQAEQERVKNKTCLSLFLSPWSLWSLWAEFSQQHNVLWVVTQVKFPSTVISRGAGCRESGSSLYSDHLKGHSVAAKEKTVYVLKYYQREISAPNPLRQEP